MEKWLKRSVDLLTSLAFGGEGSPSVIPYYPQKTEISGEEKKYFPRAIPEKFGISSKRIYNMLCELEGERRANIHNLLVLAGGEVIAECSRDGYGINTWHLSHSMSKTVTGMAIGMLFDDGLIKPSDRALKFFPEVRYKDKRIANLTVEHLLAMQSGVPFAEAGAVTESNWTEAFFASSLKFAPGAAFSYNSMNSYILAEIAARVSGKSLTEFLKERLFEPLGIRNYFWEIGPSGVEKGGWGLFLSAESWAKIGYTVLSGGVFEGRRILSEEWIEMSTAMHSIAPMVDGDFNYAYQLWVGRNSEEILFNGMLGQNVWISPKNNIVVVINSGNNELFQLSPAMDIIRKYLGGDIEDSLVRRDIRVLQEREAHFFDSRRWVRPLEKKRGVLYFLHFRSRTSFDERWQNVLGSYALPKNNVSILPLFITGMQNNLDSCIEEITLSRFGESLALSFVESGRKYSFEVGLYEYIECELELRGERYILRAMGEALEKPTGETEYRIELLLPEMPNTRMIKITRDGDEGRLKIEFSEVPNNKIVDMLIARIPSTGGAAAFALDLLERRFGKDFIGRKVEDIFRPVVMAVDKSRAGYEKILRREEEKNAERSSIEKIIRGVVARFFRETSGEPGAAPAPSLEEDGDAKEEKKKGVFGGILDIFKSKSK